MVEPLMVFGLFDEVFATAMPVENLQCPSSWLVRSQPARSQTTYAGVFTSNHRDGEDRIESGTGELDSTAVDLVHT
jgi:hypothetical protein